MPFSFKISLILASLKAWMAHNLGLMQSLHLSLFLKNTILLSKMAGNLAARFLDSGWS